MTYKEFIDNILEERGRFSCGEEYHERHHILPKRKGGTDNKENLIDLFAKEHFIAHKLLAEENNIPLSTFKSRLHKGKGDFVYFEDYQNKQH